MLTTFLTDVGAQAAAIGAILGALIVAATFAQRTWGAIDKLDDWRQVRRNAAIARSVKPVIDGAVSPLAATLSAHLAEEEALVAAVRDDFRAFVDRYDKDDAELWATLSEHGIDRRKP